MSADPRHATDVRRCAEALAGQLRRIGLDAVRVHPTAGHPLVYGEWCGRPGAPTVLIYGHYDVQPVDPPGAWHSPPFTPTYRNDHVYGRGTSDDKGQLCAQLGAVEAWLRGVGRLPVNVRCLLDGEEEIGSPRLPAFLREHRRDLAADAVVVSDTRMLGPGRPALTVGLRGLLTLEVEVRGPAADLHAGTYGGAVHNPAQVLAELVAGLHDRRGRVAVPGFYDQVRHCSVGARRRLASVAPNDAAILREAGVTRDWGEPGWSPHERTTLRPAVTVNSLTSGYQGAGRKSVIPARATAKLGIRLVPDQDPTAVERLVRLHLARISPPSVRTLVRAGSRVPATVFDGTGPAACAASDACLRAFGARPAHLLSGGTIPAAGMLQSYLGAPVVLMGFALPTDRAHAPNERFHLPTMWRGVETVIWLLEEIASRSARGSRTLVARGPAPRHASAARADELGLWPA